MAVVSVSGCSNGNGEPSVSGQSNTGNDAESGQADGFTIGQQCAYSGGNDCSDVDSSVSGEGIGGVGTSKGSGYGVMESERSSEYVSKSTGSAECDG